MKFEKTTKPQPPPGIFHDLLAKLTTVLGNEIKCAIPQFIFYTPAVVKTYKHSQVLGPSLTCRMQRNWS